MWAIAAHAPGSIKEIDDDRSHRKEKKVDYGIIDRTQRSGDIYHMHMLDEQVR